LSWRILFVCLIILLSKKDPEKDKEFNHIRRGQIPLMIIYPANPERPGVYLDGAVSPADALKALKYAEKYS